MFTIPDILSYEYSIPGIRVSIDEDNDILGLYNRGIVFAFDDANHPGWGYGFTKDDDLKSIKPIFQKLNDEEGTAFFFVDVEKKAKKIKKQIELYTRYLRKMQIEQQKVINEYVKEADSGLMPGLYME